MQILIISNVVIHHVVVVKIFQAFLFFSSIPGIHIPSQMASSGPNRRSSRVSVGSIGPQVLGPNGAYSSVGLSNPHFAAMASSQNLPAVLNDPRKGMCKHMVDGFRSFWGAHIQLSAP
jgi:hypothetical protein